ncbi:MAG: Crp/Fnr family transcriptional regulator [Bacteroidales bacterium]|nr:Crp/Fnr family transcriptional regulator [Bacteroidales bacterium]
MTKPEKESCESCRFKSCAVEVLDSDELNILQTNCSEAVFKRNELIFREGTPHSGIAYVKSGLVKIHKMGPVKDQILKLVKAPQFIGIPTVLGNKVNQYTATALIPTHTCFIATDVFRKLILLNGKFANEIINNLCFDELSFFDRSIHQTQKQIHGRVADALLLLSNDIFQSDSFQMPLNRTDLGDLVHARRESVTRTLTHFRKDNLISIKGKTIELLNKSMLERISKSG